MTTETTAPNLRLHAIIDPYCGWCYATAPLLDIAQGMPHINVVLHGGGMLIDTQVVHVSPQFKAFVMPDNERITQMTGQPFGKAYTEGLLNDHNAVLDSMQPTTAMLAAEMLGAMG